MRFGLCSKPILGIIMLLLGVISPIWAEGSGYDILTTPVSLADRYGVTEAQLSEAAKLFIGRVPEFRRLQSKLNEFQLSVGTYGGTSREVVQAVVNGIVNAGSYRKYIEDLKATEVIEYLDWHRLGSDLDIILLNLGPPLSSEQKKQVHEILRDTFPPSLFYKAVDAIWPSEHFSRFPLMTEHFEATSNLIITDAGFRFIDELNGVVDGKAVNFGRWGVQQFLRGEFDFRMNPAAQPDTFRDLRQTARWVRYPSEFPWMRLSRSSLKAIRELLAQTKRANHGSVLGLFRSGNSLQVKPETDGQRIVEALEKLQLYSADVWKTVELLEESGLAALVREAGIADQRLLKPLRNRTREEEARAKSAGRLGRELKLYHRTHLHAAQNISLGAIWVSDNQTIIKGANTRSALTDAALYAAPGFQSITYGDFYVELYLNPDAVEGIDYVRVSDWYAIRTRQALQTAEDGRLKFKKVTRRLIIDNAANWLSSRSLDIYQVSSVVVTLATLLRLDSQSDRELFLNLARAHDLFLDQALLHPRLQRELLERIADPDFRAMIFEYLNKGRFTGGQLPALRWALESHSRHQDPELLALISKILRNLRDTPKAWDDAVSDRSFMDALAAHDRSLWTTIMKKAWMRYPFDLSQTRDRVLAREILQRVPGYSRVGELVDRAKRATDADAIALVDELSKSSELNFHAFIASLAYDERVSPSVREYALSKARLSKAELELLHATLQGQINRANWNLLHRKFGVQRLMEVTVWSLGDIQDATQTLREKNPNLFSKSEWERQLNHLANLVITNFIEHDPKDYTLEFLDGDLRRIGLENLPRTLDSRTLHALYSRRAGRSSDFRLGVLKVLKNQTSIPDDLYLEFLKDRSDRGEERALATQFPFPAAAKRRFLRQLREYDFSIYGSRANVRRPNPSLELLKSGRGWFPATYIHLLAVWKALPAPALDRDDDRYQVASVMRQAPELPSAWRTQLAVDLASDDPKIISAVAFIVFSRERPREPRLEEAFMRRVERFSGGQQVDLLKQLLQHGLLFSDEMWGWYADRLDVLSNDCPLVGQIDYDQPLTRALKDVIDLSMGDRWLRPPDWWWPRFAKSALRDSQALAALAYQADSAGGLPPALMQAFPAPGSAEYKRLSKEFRIELDKIFATHAQLKEQQKADCAEVFSSR